MNSSVFARYLAEEGGLPVGAIIGIIAAVLLAVLVVVYLILARKYSERITYKREFSEKGSYEGDELFLIETIANRSFLPFFFIDIEYYIFNELQYDDYVPERDRNMQYTRSRFRIILPYMRIRRKHTIKLKKRGFYQLDTVTIWYGRRERRISAPAEVYVYPKMTGIDELPIPSSSMQGDAFSKQWLIKDPFSVSGIREYRFGDPFNSINFKATAKSGKLGFDGIRVNNRDFCSNRNFMVYLNFQSPTESAIDDKVFGKYMERGLSYAAALLREAFTFGYRAGFAANCNLVSGEKFVRFPVTQGVIHYEEILQHMSLVSHSEGISFAALLQNDILGGLCDSEVFLLTSYMNEALDGVVDNFHKFGNNVSVIMLGDLKD